MQILLVFLITFTTKASATTPTISTPTVTTDELVMKNDTKLRDSVGNVVDMFGWSLAMTESHFACGILHSDGPGFRKVGSVFIYTRHGSVLTWHSQLTAPESDRSIGFGNAIAVNARYIVVSSVDKNAIYVHDLQNNVMKQKIVSPQGIATDMFGASVGISPDDIIVVGAGKSNTGSRQQTGAVYVFHPIIGGNWTISRTLRPSELRKNAHFGQALGITTTYIGVAAAGQAVQGINQAGCVYVFTRNTSNKTHFISLSSPNPLRKDRFSYSVSFGHERIVIATERSQHVFIFKMRSRDSSDWIVETKLSQMPRDQGFGASVSIHQNKLLVAADKCKGRVENSGCANIYVRTRDGRWTFDRRLIAHDQHSHETFGIAATLKNGIAIVAKSRGYEMAKTGGGAMIRGELYIFPIGMENENDEKNIMGINGDERSGENYIVFLSVLGPVGGLGILIVVLLLLWTRITGKVLPCDGSLRRRRQSDEFVIMVNELEDVT